MNRIFCISAGQLIVKKTDNKISRRNRYLNYGLLSLATILKQEGWNPVQIHGHFESPSITLQKCISLGFNYSSLPLLISVPSFYAISWLNEFIELVKESNPKVKIILGGRWVIGNRKDLMKKAVPKADIVVAGIADSIITQIIRSDSSCHPINLSIKSNQINQYPSLDYSLLVERHLYQPSIEVARGCGMGCSFCQEKDEKLLPLKAPQVLIEEIKSTIIRDELTEMTPYFEASMFVPNGKWVDEFQLLRNKYNLEFKWRAEGRVDAINSKHIKKLAQTGLKVLDLGLESASLQQLTRMSKTKNPEKYLFRASDLIKNAYVHNINIKVNILLSAGENEETISETLDWLEKHREYIKGVSVGPVIVFGWSSNTKEYIKELARYGASISHSPALGITHLNLSDEIDYEKSIMISKEISRQFMGAEDYFYLKSFSYFSRDYRYEDFLADISSEKSDYSFNNALTITNRLLNVMLG
ncbi:hypothetical protein PN36_16300 [Candidatus Thiomargarita nelsonii]|uniref:Radical SAM core domain-containing protein n=1 Tax=Candidatus Thiomargarita nelsonii TaxID=1003181 RepID=A0A4E0QPL1_9GAMM|nr:hypothetical protein PN36_16300 [Candidatus Thiomargarita nelsonii]